MPKTKKLNQARSLTIVRTAMVCEDGNIVMRFQHKHLEVFTKDQEQQALEQAQGWAPQNGRPVASAVYAQPRTQYDACQKKAEHSSRVRWVESFLPS